MKKILKIVLAVIVCAYILVAVVTTVSLLKRDDYGVTKIFGHSFFIVEDDDMKPTYPKDTLLIFGKVENKDIKVGDNIFYEDAFHGNSYVIKLNEVTKKTDVNENNSTYVTKDNSMITTDNILGLEKDVKTSSTFGKIFSVLQSKWGFLFIIVFPLFLAFIYEIYAIVKEVKKS